MSKLSNLILFFAFIFAIFILGSAFLGWKFGAYPLMEWGDVFDLLTPLVLLPLYWLLFKKCCEAQAGKCKYISVIVLTGLWAMGHGMHLVVNSIGHLLEGSGDVYTLTYFYDKVLSHYIWYLGIVGLAILFLIWGWRNPDKQKVGYTWSGSSII